MATISSDEPIRLQGCYEGVLYGTIGRTLYVEDERTGSFHRRGTVPERYANGSYSNRLTGNDYTRAVLQRLFGRVSTVTVHRVSDRVFVGTIGRSLLRSHDGGRSWQFCRSLPPTSPGFGVLPSAIETVDGTIYVGEYPLSPESAPGILVSHDRGISWNRVAVPGVRHIHSVQGDPFGGEIWVTTGDRDDECWIGRLRDGSFERIGGGSQHWRAVELAFTPKEILWGMDCAYADRTHIYRLTRHELSNPPAVEPEAVHSLDGPVFFATTVEHAGDHWVVFSTAAEPDTDSTGPDKADTLRTKIRRISVRQCVGGDRTGTSGRLARIVASSSRSGFTDWYELRQYTRKRSIGDLVPGDTIPRANAYVYLVSADDRGIFLNPYNTDIGCGTIRRADLESLPTL